MEDFKYFVIGGDLRSAYLARSLYKNKRKVKMAFGDEYESFLKNEILSHDWRKDLKNSNIIIFPLPVTRDNVNLNTSIRNSSIELTKIISELNPEQIILGGAVNQETKNNMEQNGLRILDYLKGEEPAILNAVLTAEGAVKIAMDMLPITIWKSRCLVIGFGRVAKALVKVLKGLAAEITVVARKDQDLAWGNVLGCDIKSFDKILLAVTDKDIIFNTVPNEILRYEELKNVDKKSLLIELASEPGGINLEAAQKLGLRVNIARGLPGKYSPKTAGDIIKKSIEKIIEMESIK